MVWYGMLWYDVVWYGMVWYSMVWYGIVWYGMVWYGMAQVVLIIKNLLTFKTVVPTLTPSNTMPLYEELTNTGR